MYYPVEDSSIIINSKRFAFVSVQTIDMKVIFIDRKGKKTFLHSGIRSTTNRIISAIKSTLSFVHPQSRNGYNKPLNDINFY